VRSDGHRLAMLRDPAGYAMPNLQPKLVDKVGVRVLRGAQDKPIAFEDIDEARVTGNNGGDKIDDATEHEMERVGRGDAAADLVKKVDRRQAVAETSHGGGGNRNPANGLI
jgi:hypothetical protein